MQNYGSRKINKRLLVVPPDYTKENNQTDIKLHRRFSEIIHQNNS